MTLTEFLLARIAEDEEQAKYADPHYDECEHLHYFSEGGLPCTCGLEGRLLAECEAKRRIVERISDSYFCGSPFDADSLPRLLALPYADHSDYREEWAL